MPQGQYQIKTRAATRRLAKGGNPYPLYVSKHERRLTEQLPLAPQNSLRRKKGFWYPASTPFEERFREPERWSPQTPESQQGGFQISIPQRSNVSRKRDNSRFLPTGPPTPPPPPSIDDPLNPLTSEPDSLAEMYGRIQQVRDDSFLPEEGSSNDNYLALGPRPAEVDDTINEIYNVLSRVYGEKKYPPNQAPQQPLPPSAPLDDTDFFSEFPPPSDLTDNYFQSEPINYTPPDKPYPYWMTGPNSNLTPLTPNPPGIYSPPYLAPFSPNPFSPFPTPTPTPPQPSLLQTLNTHFPPSPHVHFTNPLPLPPRSQVHFNNPQVHFTNPLPPTASYPTIKPLPAYPLPPPHLNECRTLACPVTVPHNKGPYFHEGMPTHRPEFGYNNPPPMVWDALERIQAGVGVELDELIVRSFREFHVVSLVLGRER